MWPVPGAGGKYGLSGKAGSRWCGARVVCRWGEIHTVAAQLNLCADRNTATDDKLGASSDVA